MSVQAPKSVKDWFVERKCAKGKGVNQRMGCRKAQSPKKHHAKAEKKTGETPSQKITTTSTKRTLPKGLNQDV